MELNCSAAASFPFVSGKIEILKGRRCKLLKGSHTDGECILCYIREKSGNPLCILQSSAITATASHSDSVSAAVCWHNRGPVTDNCDKLSTSNISDIGHNNSSNTQICNTFQAMKYFVVYNLAVLAILQWPFLWNVVVCHEIVKSSQKCESPVSA